MKRYRHILVATDGSAPAREFNARLTGVFVLAEGVPTLFSGKKLYASGVISPRLRQRALRQAEQALASVEREARAAGVPCHTVKRLSRHPWRAILGAARSGGCDLVVMASHRRGSADALVRGSETARVMAHSRNPGARVQAPRLAR